MRHSSTQPTNKTAARGVSRIMTTSMADTTDLKLPEALCRAIEGCAAESDQLADIPADLHDDLRDAGAFRLLTPREYGGSEMPLPAALSVYERIGRINGSVGLLVWNANFGFIGAMLDAAGAGKIWKNGVEPVFANSGIPGTAVRVDGGFLITGQWKIVTGIKHADWLVVVGVIAADGLGAPEVRLFAIPTDQLDVRDTWDVTGMRATGSHDVVGDAIFVPTELSASLDSASRFDRPLYRGFIPTLVFAGCSAVTLGVAARMVDETVAVVRRKGAMGGGFVAEAARTQYLIAKAHASLDAARLLLQSAAAVIQRAGEQGMAVTIDQRADYRAAMTHAADVSRDVLVNMYQLAGSTALYRSNPVERLFRDGMAGLSTPINQRCSWRRPDGSAWGWTRLAVVLGRGTKKGAPVSGCPLSRYLGQRPLPMVDVTVPTVACC